MPARITRLILSALLVGAAVDGPDPLERQVSRADNVVAGTVVGRAQKRVVPPRGGEPVPLTRVTIEGRSLENGCPIVVDVTLRDPAVGEPPQPAPEETALGREVVVFYSWLDDLGEGVPGNALCGGRDGLYRVVRAPGGPLVRGHGTGAAIDRDQPLGRLGKRIGAISARQGEGRRRER